MASKVPVITAYFWIIKVLTTAMGEATSDYLAHRFDPYLVVPLGGIAFVIVLAIQLSVRRYMTWVYWGAVVMVAVFGTMAADSIHIALHVPYVLSTAVFGTALVVIFGAWYASEKTLSIHSIYTTRRELFYWATVTATFALGTAAGDLTARTLGLGFLSSGVLFAIVIAVPAVAHWKLGMNPIFAFWFAYVVTRPLGASFSDYFGLAHAYGGLGYGYLTVSVVLTIAIVGLVGYLAVSGKDVEERAAQPDGGGRHRTGLPPVTPRPVRVPVADPQRYDDLGYPGQHGQARYGGYAEPDGGSRFPGQHRESRHSGPGYDLSPPEQRRAGRHSGPGYDPRPPEQHREGRHSGPGYDPTPPEQHRPARPGDQRQDRGNPGSGYSGQYRGNPSAGQHHGREYPAQLGGYDPGYPEQHRQNGHSERYPDGRGPGDGGW